MAKTKSRYIPALDGLRALAVLAVIAYHMSLPFAEGGLLGVTVFFVLSGYLITSLLLIEWDNTHAINLPQFWLRRVRRLFPAIVVVIVCSVVLCTLFNHNLLTKLRDDIWAALLWFTNWWYILRDVSYFEALGAPSPLTHFWSLAIEEQFYLVWPIVLFCAHKFGVKRKHMMIATVVLAGASALEMAVLYDPAADPSRVYYGTDTRAFSLLIGAWLAFVWPSYQLGAHEDISLAPAVRRGLDAVGFIALAGLVALMVFVDGMDPFMYHGGILLASVLSAVVIAVIVHPASILGKMFALKPFVWVGLRSYGIYLWHYPLILIITPPTAIAEVPWWMRVIELAVIFVCAALSYTLIENPIRHGSIGAFVERVRTKQTSVGEWVRTHIPGVALAGALSLVCVGGLIFVPRTAAITDGAAFMDDTPHVAGIPATTEAESPKLDVILIGDSVTETCIDVFMETFPYGAIDSAINRQFYVAQNVYEGYERQGIIGDVVVFALGTNGRVVDSQIDELMSVVGSEKHVFFINTRCPDSWMDDTNASLASAAERYSNVSIIDWASASENKSEYFDGDGTHLTPTGVDAYVGLIKQAIENLLPSHEEGDELAGAKTPVEVASDAAKESVDHAIRDIAGALLRAQVPDESQGPNESQEAADSSAA